MKEKEEKTISPDELADYLEKVASQIRSGLFSIDDKDWKVPETVDIRIVCKEKKGRIKYKLEWRWSSLSAYDERRHKEVTQWENSFKEVKRNLIRSFKELKQIINEGLMPDEQMLQEFVRHSRSFLALADAEWQQEAEEYVEHLENLIRAVGQGQKEFIAHELRDLQNRMVACHKEFR